MTMQWLITILISDPILSVGVVRCVLQPDPAGDHLGDGDGGSRAPPSLQVCTVLYCTVLYCTVLYCTVLYSGGGQAGAPG